VIFHLIIVTDKNVMINRQDKQAQNIYILAFPQEFCQAQRQAVGVDFLKYF